MVQTAFRERELTPVILPLQKQKQETEKRQKEKDDYETKYGVSDSAGRRRLSVLLAQMVSEFFLTLFSVSLLSGEGRKRREPDRRCRTTHD